MKCRRCRQKAAIELPQHNAGFCSGCFFHHCQNQVTRAVDEFGMWEEGQRIVVGVSGGKDSLALWDLLTGMGVRADGIYLDLGIDGYSSRSGDAAAAFAAARGLELKRVDVAGSQGFDIPYGAKASHRAACGVCGLSKRHLLNAEARSGGYDVVATGHNLDDEAATLFGNLLRWQIDYVGRQRAVLPATAEGFVKKVKPLVRLGEREMAAYCVLKGIDYVVEECPLAAGNTGLRMKEALDLIEAASPGSKHAFLFGYFARGAGLFEQPPDSVDLVACEECFSPTPAPCSGSARCAFCRMRAQILEKRGART